MKETNTGRKVEEKKWEKEGDTCTKLEGKRKTHAEAVRERG